MSKVCNDCKESKPLSEFRMVSSSKSLRKADQEVKETPHTYCRSCLAKRSKIFRKKYKKETGNADYRGTGKINSREGFDRKLMSAIRKKISWSKRNHKRHKDTEFDIDDEYMFNLFKEQQGKCALTGFPMSLDGNTNIRLSIDKIVPSLGYTKENVQWTIFAANRAKGNLSHEDFLKLCKMVLERATTIEK